MVGLAAPAMGSQHVDLSDMRVRGGGGPERASLSIVCMYVQVKLVNVGLAVVLGDERRRSCDRPPVR